MPRGPADRPLRPGDDEVPLRAAMRRALEQGAAPLVYVRVPDPEAVRPGGRVAQAAALRPAAGVERHPPARSFVLVRRGRKSADRVPDPRGRGGKVDVRV